MNKKIVAICFVLCLIINFSIATANISSRNDETKILHQTSEYIFSDDYFVQWEMNFGSDRHYGARYEGPQPIGDCDNDGKNEMLVAGRDNKIRIFECLDCKKKFSANMNKRQSLIDKKVKEIMKRPHISKTNLGQITFRRMGKNKTSPYSYECNKRYITNCIYKLSYT